MRQAGGLRLSLILPVSSPRAYLRPRRSCSSYCGTWAALNSTSYAHPPRPAETPRPIVPGGVLFAATTTSLSPDNAPARDRLERIVRGYIERQYTRQGIMPVAYELELL